MLFMRYGAPHCEEKIPEMVQVTPGNVENPEKSKPCARKVLMAGVNPGNRLSSV